jgi:hypothetical protein
VSLLRRTYLEPSTADTGVCLRIRHLLHVRHDGALVGGVDDIAWPRGQGVAPRERCLGAGLDGDDGVGLGCGVGAAVADDVVGRYVCDGLKGLLAAVSCRSGREDVRETYAIVGGTAPPFSETKMVCAVADDAAAAIARDVESFIVDWGSCLRA